MKLRDRWAWFRYNLWRWYFSRFTLPKLVNKSYEQLRVEYGAYQKRAWANKHTAMSFEDWCGER